MSDGHFGVGDLLVADQSNGMRPPVEARVSSGRLLAFTELYADSAEVWQDVAVHLDVGRRRDRAGAKPRERRRFRGPGWTHFAVPSWPTWRSTTFLRAGMSCARG